MKSLRIVFFGTPDFAVASLKALVEAGFNVAAVVTAPDKPAGRGHHLQQPPVKQYATELGLPVLQPVNLKDEQRNKSYLSTNNTKRSTNLSLKSVVLNDSLNKLFL